MSSEFSLTNGPVPEDKLNSSTDTAASKLLSLEQGKTIAPNLVTSKKLFDTEQVLFNVLNINFPIKIIHKGDQLYIVNASSKNCYATPTKSDTKYIVHLKNLQFESTFNIEILLDTFDESKSTINISVEVNSINRIQQNHKALSTNVDWHEIKQVIAPESIRKNREQQ